MNDSNAKELRKVGDAEAFYFYRALGNFTGQKANSLEDFLEKVKEIDGKSLEFHLLREDLEKWMKFTISDSQLAMAFGQLREQKMSDEDLRNSMFVLVSKRLTELTDTSNAPRGKKQTKKKTHI